MERRSFLAGAAALAMAACSSSDSKGAATSPVTVPTTPTSAPTSSSSTPSLPAFLSRSDSTADEVALTFHTNGDPSLVSNLLDLLAERHVAITAFVVGSWLVQNPAFARRLVDEAHEIANHTQTHPSSFRTRSADVMTREISECRATLQRLTGTTGRWFRPSGTANGTDDPGASVRARAAALGYHTVVGYDVDPSDYADPGARAVRDRTLASVRAGSIVSLHTGHQGTIDALPAILDGIDRDGLRPVTVATLLGVR